jgi:hypothetical protein
MRIPSTLMRPVLDSKVAVERGSPQACPRRWRMAAATSLALLLAAASAPASALPGTFDIDQIFSNASGTVQFVVIRDRGRNDCDSGEDRWAGQTLASVGGPGPNRTFVFPTDLPTCATSGKRILIATEAFATLGLVAPDYVVPNGFVQIPYGTLDFAGVSRVGYTSLPNDGVTAILAGGTPVQNRATNLAGQTASVTAPAGFAIQSGLSGTWNSPGIPGQGFLIEVNTPLDALVLGWFTWSTTEPGRHDWLSALGPIDGDSATVELQRSSGGLFNDAADVATASVGTATFRFTDCSTGTVTYQRTDIAESGVIPIRRLTPVPPDCTAPGGATHR